MMMFPRRHLYVLPIKAESRHKLVLQTIAAWKLFLYALISSHLCSIFASPIGEICQNKQKGNDIIFANLSLNAAHVMAEDICYFYFLFGFFLGWPTKLSWFIADVRADWEFTLRFKHLSSIKSVSTQPGAAGWCNLFDSDTFGGNTAGTEMTQTPTLT